MRTFTALYTALDATTSTLGKVRALREYFEHASPADAAWATYFLVGRRFRRLVRASDLRGAALAASELPDWLFDACMEAVGDFAETIALVLPTPTRRSTDTLAHWVEHRIAPLGGLAEQALRDALIECWSMLDRDERLVFGKLLTGAFRVGVGRELVYRALSQVSGVPVGDIAQRLMGDWQPSEAFPALLRGETAHGHTVLLHRPYPFCLAHALDGELDTLGPRDDWQVEWKWDGVRAQLLVRDDGASVWSRGEELVSEQFPEIVAAAQSLPRGTVLDGELVVWPAEHDHPAPFASLQRRLGRHDPSDRLRRDIPVRMLAYDVLERDGTDVRAMTLDARRHALEALVPDAHDATICRVPPLAAATWDEVRALRDRARDHAAEGLMLKRRDSAYVGGRPRGLWWKWKVAPFTVDAVLLYAQPGSGRRASLYTDYTFAVWHEGALVPFAKAYSGLTDAEIRELDRWIRAQTIEKFGPVRSVPPVQVFEIAFEGIRRSTRHKSGIAVRFPRIARWRRDKPAQEADTLDTLRALATSIEGGAP